MAIAAVFEVPGMTAQQYDRVIRELDRAGHGAPDGRLHHVAAATEDGWLVVDVWESPEQLQRFADVLMPRLQAASVTPPRPRVYPAHSVVGGARGG